MNKNEIAILLTAVSAIDDRVDPDEYRVAMWQETLHPKMTLQFAKQILVKHYAEQKSVIMPADFNLAWRNYSNRVAEENSYRLVASKDDAVPMPDYVKDLLRKWSAPF